jgi:hypothetical protein
MPLAVIESGVEDTTTKYFMLAHGETKRKDPYTLVVRDNLQVVFLVDPTLADTMLCTTVARIPNICNTVNDAKRWVYGPGEHKIRALDVNFIKQDNDDTVKGVYNCDGSVFTLINEDAEIPLPDAVSRFAATVPLDTPTSIYILTCTLRDKYRGFAQSYVAGGPPRSGRRPHKTRRRHKKRRTRRHR